MKRNQTVDHLLVLPILFVLIIPFIKLFLMSVKGDGLISNYGEVFSDPRVVEGIANTLIIGLVTSALTVILGTYLAFVIAYTNIKFKRILKVLVYLPFIVPGYIMTLAWTNITSSVGMVTKILARLGLAPINLYSMGGIIFVMTLCYIPFVYLSVYRSLIKVPLSSEYASHLLNYGVLETFRKINLRQIRPTLVSTFVLVFLSSLDNFSIPAFLGVSAGIPVLSTLIYEKTISVSTGGFTSPAVLSVLLFVISVSISQTEGQILKRARTGKDAREDKSVRYAFPAAVRRAVEILTFSALIFINIVPIGFMVYSSFISNYVREFSLANFSLDNYRGLFSISSIKMSMTNSLTYALITVVICALLSLVYGYFKWKDRYPRSMSLLEKGTSISYSLPGMVLALSMIFHWAKPIPWLNFGFYGGPGIILIAYVTRFLIIDMKAAHQAFGAMSHNLEYAALLSDSSFFKKWFKIFLPLIYKYILTSSLLIFVYSLTELSLSAMLSGPYTKTIGLFIFNLQQAGDYSLAYAMSTLVLILLLLLYLLMEKINGGERIDSFN
ncbi:MAG: iron ABC transporter permease [Tissierellia bacterium]|nr:iron ABC transporter permease [Tissierellia bacterium]